ncbi:MAG: response regulator transcription factor [Lachnospiraceae bacterium]|nr:response regulator transcription factor [Lachnospiraceae bacterium]
MENAAKPAILVVEDDDGVRGLIKMTLQMEGFPVTEAAGGNEGEEKIKEGGFALAILDIMLPGKDGYSLLPLLRERNVPVIFLTAKGTVSDRVLGLKAGADDYITKPFEPVELVARIEAVLRRSAGTPETGSKDEGREPLSYKNIILEEDAHRVTEDGTPVALTEKEFALLSFLLQHQGQAFSREQLLDSVWSYDYFGGTRTVDVHVSALRSKLGLTEELETVYKLGYRLRKLS